MPYIGLDPIDSGLVFIVYPDVDTSMTMQQKKFYDSKIDCPVFMTPLLQIRIRIRRQIDCKSSFYVSSFPAINSFDHLDQHEAFFCVLKKDRASTAKFL